MEAIDEGFIFCHDVRGREVKSDGISHPYSEGRDKDEACASPGLHQRPIKVQGPALILDLGWRKLGSHPLCHEIGQDLGFYGLCLRFISDLITHEFHRPLCDSAIGLPVLDHLSQREGGDHRDRVRL